MFQQHVSAHPYIECKCWMGRKPHSLTPIFLQINWTSARDACVAERSGASLFIPLTQTMRTSIAQLEYIPSGGKTVFWLRISKYSYKQTGEHYPLMFPTNIQCSITPQTAMYFFQMHQRAIDCSTKCLLNFSRFRTIWILFKLRGYLNACFQAKKEPGFVMTPYMLR